VDVRTHRLWVDAVDIAGIVRDGRITADVVGEAYRRQNGGSSMFPPRPTTFDFAAVLRQLGDVLAEKGLSRAKVAADLDFLPAADYFALVAALPDVRWSDGSGIVRRLRAIKSTEEISLLRRACALAEAGLATMVSSIAPSRSRRALSERWREGVAVEASARGISDLTGLWDFISVGPDPWGSDGRVAPGAIVKADVGCLIGGYSSDSERTYVYGEPDPLARDIHAVLLDAFHAGLTAIRPGAMLRDIHATTARVIHAAGYAGYQRGHFGHGVGASVGSEEWPFIAADSEVAAEPGMVLAFETPFYGNGIGALMIEDQILVTETGIEVMNTMRRELVRIG
jgi:Xaa-Pro aminopeptidase